MKLKINVDEIRELLDTDSPVLPKYASQILNLANQNSQGTRPRVVGQMSELIQEFRAGKGRSLDEWSEWYLSKYPDALEDATIRIVAMVEKLKIAILEIDRDMITEWVEDLVVIKTFIGLMFQEAILKKVASEKKLDYQLATIEEESQGIDGYIGDTAVSIKPATYKVKMALPEKIDVAIIYYEKKEDGLLIETDHF